MRALFRLPGNPILSILVILLWWPVAAGLWVLWFALIGWWWYLITEPYARMEVHIHR